MFRLEKMIKKVVLISKTTKSGRPQFQFERIEFGQVSPQVSPPLKPRHSQKNIFKPLGFEDLIHSDNQTIQCTNNKVIVKGHPKRSSEKVRSLRSQSILNLN